MTFLQNLVALTFTTGMSLSLFACGGGSAGTSTVLPDNSADNIPTAVPPAPALPKVEIQVLFAEDIAK